MIRPVICIPAQFTAARRAEGALIENETRLPEIAEQPATQQFITTTCRHSGRKCPAAQGLAGELARAGNAARQAVAEFEVTGSTRLNGCPLTCPAAFRVSEKGVELFCGVADDRDIAALSDFADAFLGSDGAGHIAHPPGRMPLAFVVSADGRAIQKQGKTEGSC